MNKKFYLFLCITFLYITEVTFSATPLYVIKHGTNKEIYPVDSSKIFSTIQDALTHVDDGGIIYITKGIYQENITITKSVTLIGEGETPETGASKKSPTLHGGASSTVATVTIGGTKDTIQVTLRNLNITKGLSGINVLSNAKVTIKNNTISQYQKNGITFGPLLFDGYGGITGTITNNSIQGNGKQNIFSQNGIQISEDNQATISNNNISNHIFFGTTSIWATGILVHHTKNVFIVNNTLENNQAGINIKQASKTTIANNFILGNMLTKAGIMVSDYNDKTYPAIENTIKGNTILGGLVGIWTSYTSNNTYIKNKISNTIENAFYSWESNNNTFSYNTISYTTPPVNESYAIEITGEKIGSSNTTITNNSIKNNTNSLMVSQNSQNTILAENTFTHIATSTKLTENKNQGKGVVLGVSTVTFTEDLIKGNSGASVKALQKRLIKEGFLKTEATGYFGHATEEALLLWQKKHAILETGIFEKKSRDILNTSQE